MSDFYVKIEKIRDVQKHPNADRLDLVYINDWQCVAAKGEFRPGDLAIYFPIGSILPHAVESRIFPPGSKITLTKSRVRTIKLRGAISQGLAVKPHVLSGCDGFVERTANYEEGTDLTKILGVTKYEPPESWDNSAQNEPKKKKRKNNPNFHEYTHIQNAKNYPYVFVEGELVIVTEKIHGTNFRAGWVPYNADKWWKKILKFVGLAPKWEFVFGSHRVQLQNKANYGGYYKFDPYTEAVEKYDLKTRLPKGIVVYGEIYGDKIQKGYTYGCGKDERKLVIFDVMRDGQFVDSVITDMVSTSLGLENVPIIFIGPFHKDQIYTLRDGPSKLAPVQKVREGVVVKPLKERTSHMGRVVLKYISDEYLLKNQDNETIAH